MNAFVEQIAPWLADYFLLATLLLTIVLLLFRLINQPARRLVLARPTLAALLLLTGLCALPGWSLVHLLTENKPAQNTPALSPIQAAPPIEQPATPSIPNISPQPSQSSSTPVRIPAPITKPFSWLTWLVRIYLGGSLLAIVWQTSGSFLARRIIRQATAAPPALQNLLGEFSGTARLLVSNHVQAPAALGLLQPTILLPRQTSSSKNDTLRPILAHELAHIHHGDLQTLAAVRLLTILLWPHPLFWRLRRQVRLDQETLADAAAADISSRTDYAAQLVAWATPTHTPRLASSVGLWESPSQLRQRIALLLDKKRTILRTCTRQWSAACAILIALVALGLSLVTLQPSTAALGKPADDSAVAELSEEQQRQVRLAIKTISKPGLVEPVEEWGYAVQTLVEIGRPAVPSLIEALDSEVLDHPMRKIAFTLRAIDDKRAIPALIRAIPRTLQPSASGYGLRVEDNSLSKFLTKYDTRDGDKSFTYGRAFREVALTLQKMTDGVSHGEMELNFVHKEGSPNQQALQKELFEKAATRWARWWEANWEDYLSDSQYAKVGLPPQVSPSLQSRPTNKPVRFPVGDNVRLSEGSSGVCISPAENPRECFYDLDTGRHASWPSELPAWGVVDENSPEVIAWARKEGFDLLGILETGNGTAKKYGVKMFDLRAWEITETQFKELPKAMRGEISYPLKKEKQRMVAMRDSRSHVYGNPDGNSYLFQTREGSYGVIKLHEPGDGFPYDSVKAKINFFIQVTDASSAQKEEDFSVSGPRFLFHSSASPADADSDENSTKRTITPAGFNLLDLFKTAAEKGIFQSREPSPLDPWKKQGLVTYKIYSFDPNKISSLIEPVFDESAGYKEAWEGLLEGLAKDPNGPQIDLHRDFFAKLSGQITVLTEEPMPKDGNPDTWLVYAPASHPADLLVTLKRFMRVDPNAVMIKISGQPVWKLPSEKNEEHFICVAFGQLFASNRLDLLTKVLDNFSAALDNPINGTFNHATPPAEESPAK